MINLLHQDIHGYLLNTVIPICLGMRRQRLNLIRSLLRIICPNIESFSRSCDSGSEIFSTTFVHSNALISKYMFTFTDDKHFYTGNFQVLYFVSFQCNFEKKISLELTDGKITTKVDFKCQKLKRVKNRKWSLNLKCFHVPIKRIVIRGKIKLKVIKY